MPNIEDEVFRSYRLNELPPNELLIHGDTEMVSKFFIKYLLPLIEKNSKDNGPRKKINVLELGGGTCFESYYVKRKIKNSTVVASDISPYVLSVSRNLSNLFRVKLDNRCACDAQHLPFMEKTFDIIFGTEFLHHCESLTTATREIARILIPGGLFLGIEPMCGKITKPMILVLSGAKSRILNEHVFENRYTHSQWRLAFENANLKTFLSVIDDPEIYKAMIGKKCVPSSFKGRYLSKYIYSSFLTPIPHSLQKKAPNATLRIIAIREEMVSKGRWPQDG